MAQLRYTRNLFLRGICIIYLFAFLSFYVQIPGEALHLSAEATSNADHTSAFFSFCMREISSSPRRMFSAKHFALNIRRTLDAA